MSIISHDCCALIIRKIDIIICGDGNLDSFIYTYIYYLTDETSIIVALEP